MKYKKLSLFSLAIFTMASCSLPQSIPILKTEKGRLNLDSNIPEKKEELPKPYTQEVEPYTKAIELKIDTGINKEFNKKILRFKDEELNFSTKSVPSGNIVFQETFNFIKTKKVKIQRNFRVSDTTKRYSLYIKRENQYSKNESLKAKVNINGFDWIRNKDFKCGDEALNESLLLNSNNLLSIELNEQKNSTFTIVVIEGGASGIIRNRIKPLGEHETNEKHIKAGDNNIFNPNDINSLGGLIPVTYGDTILGDTSISYSEVDGTKSTFVTGTVIVKLKEPVQQNLQTLLQRHNLELESLDKFGSDSIASVKVKYEYVNLSEMINNIKEINLTSPLPITNASFSSINTAKTVASFVDILNNSSDLVYSAGFNSIMEQASARTPSPEEGYIVTDEDKTSTFSFLNDYDIGGSYTKPVPHTSKESYWIRESSIDKAWKYSLGQNTKVAILDADFGRIKSSSILKNRVLLPHKEAYLSMCAKSIPLQEPFEFDPCYALKAPGHGFAISSIIASEIDDNIGVSGVAPRTKIIPFGIFPLGGEIAGDTGISNFLYKLNGIKEYNELPENRNGKGIDVVNISSTATTSRYDSINPNASNCASFSTGSTSYRPICSPTVLKMTDLLAEMTTPSSGINSITFVSAIGNGGYNLNEGDTTSNPQSNLYYPGGLPYVIAVGAYQVNDITGNIIRSRAKFDTILKNDSGTAINYKESNYGSPVDIWAPGDNIPIFIPKDVNKINTSSDEWKSVSGTSFASPIVVGVVSMIKSLRKDLSFGQILTILQESGDFINEPNRTGLLNFFRANATSDERNSQKFLNASSAMEYLITNSSRPLPSSPITMAGRYTNYGELRATSSELLVSNLFPSYQDFYNDLIGKHVFVSGWFDSENAFTVLQMREQSAAFRTFNIKGILDDNSQSKPLDVKPNNTFAVPITTATRDLSKFSISLGGGQNITLKEIVDDYLIAKVPPNLPQGIQDVIIKEVGRGDITYHNALRILAGLEILATPLSPVTFPNATTIPPSDDDLETNLYTTEISELGTHVSKKLKEVIALWANNGIVTSLIPESMDIIKNFAKPVNQNIHPNYEVSLDLLALSLGYQPINCPTYANYSCNSDRFSNIVIQPSKFIDNNLSTASVEVQPNQSVGVAVDGDLNGLQVTSEGQGFEVQSISKDFVSVEVPATLSSGVHDITVKTDLGEVIFREAINIRTNNQIAFDSNRDGNQEIYVMYEDGSNQRRLTFTSNRYDYGATWSPNKEKIAFDSEHNSGEEDIFVVNPDGTGMMNLTNSPDDEWDPFWSYDGTKVIFISDVLGNDDICEINADGTNRRQLTTDSADEYNPSYSPDGSKIVYISEVDGTAEIYIMNADGSGKTRLTNSSYGNGRPKWSMTGKKISWESYTANNDSHIWQMNPDGSGKEQLTFNDDYRPWYSPDGTKIAYHTYINNDRRDIKVLDLRTRVETNLTAVNPSKTLFDGWLNDSSKVLYSSKMDGDYEIYSQRYDGSDLRQLTFNTADDFNAAAHSHREVFTTLSMSKSEKVKIARRRAKYDIPERHNWKLKK